MTRLDDVHAPDKLPLFTRQRLRGPAWLAVLLPSLPAVLLGFFPEASTGFASVASSLRTLGQLTGMLAYTSFATDIVIGARVPAVEKLFGALDRMYRYHRRLGVGVAALLAAHLVLIVSSQALLSGDAAVALFIPDPVCGCSRG